MPYDTSYVPANGNTHVSFSAEQYTPALVCGVVEPWAAAKPETARRAIAMRCFMFLG
jgi:hypothetical protein